ncbi:OLC1v1012943C1 [Oldenlandia corymbosa var. corymbosa]|uniref:OLC1v1012943C1 n=1 Tax=Oldenlandia corymbosa var. corymbosa TaxID=529605 RepID=A0AAV1DZ47_OLDCO|nr:OLC1v1012943C1 [Oldenlandia corymbosa var. corymbosa]
MARISPPVAPPPRTFASFFQKPPEVEVNVDSLIKQVKFVNGTPTLEYEDEEFERLVAPHRLCLVGKFSYGRPKMEEIHNEFKKIGFQGGYTLGRMNPRHVLIRFDQEEDYQRCWIRIFWNIGGYSMRILKWKPGFKFQEYPSVMPIWVSLYDLPIEFMHPEVIFSMEMALGKPLKVDAPTLNMTRPSVARFCVEIDLTKELPKSVKIGKKGRKLWPAPKKKGLKLATAKPKWLFKGDGEKTSGATELEAGAHGSVSDGDTDDALVSVLFIIKPMLPSYQIDSVPRDLGFEMAFSLATSKIWVFCRNGLSLRLLESSDQVIHFEAMHCAVPGKFLLSAVYAKSTRNARRLLWQNMVDFRLMYSAAPWLIGGNFNVIRTLDEYSGNSVQDPVATTEFNECILECDLLELPGVGENNFAEWSDCPMLHKFDVNIESKPKIFRFQKMWLRRSDFKEIVKESWEQPLGVSGMLGFALKLKRLKEKLKVWNKKTFGDIFANLRDAGNKVQELENAFDTSGQEQDRVSLHVAKADNINDFLATHIQEFLDDNGNNDDLLVWKHTSIGDLTVKLAYDVIRPRRQSEGWARTVWNPFTPLRVSIFLWKLCNRLVPFPEVLDQMGINVYPAICLVCRNGGDGLFHCFYGSYCRVVEVKWIPPPVNSFSLNTDGSSSRNEAGYGFVIRGTGGSFIYGENGYLGDGDSFMAEVYGVLFGLRKCEQLGLSNVVVRTDNKSLADSLERGSIFPWKYLLQEIYASLQRNALTITYIYREDNAVADMIAKKASSGSSGVYTSLDALPKYVKGLLILDQSSFPYFRSRIL